MEEIIYLNDHLIPRSQARLSPFDHGFLYAYGLFETMRAYGGHIFRLDRHLARLHRSAEILELDSQLASLDLQKACYDVLKANELAEGRLRLAISAGEGGLIPDPGTCSGITVFVAVRRLVPLPPGNYERGFTVVLSSWQRNSQSPLSRLKSSCYLENVLARQEARALGADEALILNERGLVAEASSANLFLEKDGTLTTPSVESGALAGITREIVLKLARSLGLETVEREVQVGELVEADEAFLTNSILEVMPLTRFGDSAVGPGKAGPLAQRFMQAYKELVQEETSPH